MAYPWKSMSNDTLILLLITLWLVLSVTLSGHNNNDQ